MSRLTKSKNILYVLKVISFSLIVLGLLLPSGSVNAQEAEPEGPVYIVREGDSLWIIAVRFGISLEELQRINGITNPEQLSVGDRLVIPGLEGISGVITSHPIPYGETIHSLARRHQLPESTLIQLNRLSSPAELYTGSNLIIPDQVENQSQNERLLITGDQTYLEVAAANNLNPWTPVTFNNLPGSWSVLAGDVIHYPGESDQEEEIERPGGLPEAIQSVEIKPITLLQGKSTIIEVIAPEGSVFNGSLMGHELSFYPYDKDKFVAILGVHAMAEPGIYQMELNGELSDGKQFEFSQMVRVEAIDYPYDRPLTVNPTTIDPAVTKPENAQWNQLASTSTPDKMWEGVFQLPSPLPAEYCLKTNNCWSSLFGNRRSYNGGPYNSFHTGMDIVGGVGTEIFAPAPGVVVFAGPLTVRGNATMIDHGWGVYSAYMHQDEIYVEVGDRVETGQVIGVVGGTGRVEGPHLHWEIWAGGVQVDPLDWLKLVYP